jgi:cell division cycle protein 20 (cofactor of APC complex)
MPYLCLQALAWCPWAPHLLATGTTFPDGSIRIFNVSDALVASTPKPQHTARLDTSVLSLIWSPHCKELLSTQGTSFISPPAPQRPCTPSHPTRPSSEAGPVSQPKFHPIPHAPLANSIVVHAFPSMERVTTVKKSHLGVVTHGCLSPDGTMVFTVCPGEEAMKMWRVWGEPQKAGERESAFDRWSIR